MGLPFIVFYTYILLRGSLRPVLESGLELWLFDILGFVCPSILILWFYTKCLHVPFSRFYLYSDHKVSASSRRELFILSIVYVPLFCAGAYLSEYAAYYIAPHFPNMLPINYSTLPSYKAPMSYFVRTYLALTSGVIEELIFRGGARVIWRNMISPVNHYGYVIFSAVIFGMLHWIHGLVNVIEATLQGILLAILYMKLNDLRPLMVGHAIWDII